MAWLPPSIKGKTVHHYDLPAWWSGALLNNDRTSLALDVEDLAEFEGVGRAEHAPAQPCFVQRRVVPRQVERPHL